jgi:hypothetical protein
MQQIAERSRLARPWLRLVAAVQPRPKTARPATAEPGAAIDPVALTIMAVNRLGPATLRAVSSGVPVTVAAPDRQTAEIFRAALSEMGKARPTDRLVSIALAEER